MDTDRLLEIVRAALASITHPRLYETERGFQGELVSNLNVRLDDIGLGRLLVEQEYQKVIELHGFKTRPDIIIHIPFEESDFENPRQGNYVVFELKLRATQKEAFGDFDKLEQMGEFLDYPFGFFINIDASDTFLQQYKKRTDIELFSFAVRLEQDDVVISEFPT